MSRYVINGVEVPVEPVSATAITPIAPPSVRLPHIAPNDPSAALPRKPVPEQPGRPDVGTLVVFAGIFAGLTYVLLKKPAKSAPRAPQTA